MNRSKTQISTRYFHRCARNAIGCLLLVSGYTNLQGQSAISTAGGDGTGSGGSVAFTVGQVAYTNFSGEGGSVSLGVQQPNVILTVGFHDLDITLTASVFPNPANASTSLQVDTDDITSTQKDLSFYLFDINGQLLKQQTIQSSVTTIPMDNLTEGVYILQVRKENVLMKSFKIFKTN